MKVRYITASSMQKALRKISEELGGDAVILSNRKVPEGVEIVAALDYNPIESHALPATYGSTIRNLETKKQVPQIGLKSQKKSSQSLTRRPLKKTPYRQNPLQHPEVERQLELQNELAKWRQTAPNLPRESTSDRWLKESKIKASLESLEKQKGDTVTAMRLELDLLHKMLTTDQLGQSENQNHTPSWRQKKNNSCEIETFAEHSPAQENNDLHDTDNQALTAYPLTLPHVNASTTSNHPKAQWLQWGIYAPCNWVQAKLWENLQKLGIESWLCHQLTADVQGYDDETVAWQRSLERLRKKIPVMNYDWPKQGGILVLVGPTGAGKTTTTCKLAVERVMQQGPDSVALVTTDNYRIAAHGQLLTLGRILGIPVKTLQPGQALDEILATLTQFPALIIDTAGLTEEDPDLSLQMNTLKQSQYPKKILLTLPSTSQGRCLRALIDLYEPLNPMASILTKIDETPALGEALSVIIERQLPVAFVSQGQRIPDDLIKSDRQKLVAMTVKKIQKVHEYQSNADQDKNSKINDSVLKKFLNN